MKPEKKANSIQTQQFSSGKWNAVPWHNTPSPVVEFTIPLVPLAGKYPGLHDPQLLP